MLLLSFSGCSLGHCYAVAKVFQGVSIDLLGVCQKFLGGLIGPYYVRVF